MSLLLRSSQIGAIFLCLAVMGSIVHGHENNKTTDSLTL